MLVNTRTAYMYLENGLSKWAWFTGEYGLTNGRKDGRADGRTGKRHEDGRTNFAPNKNESWILLQQNWERNKIHFYSELSGFSESNKVNHWYGLHKVLASYANVFETGRIILTEISDSDSDSMTRSYNSTIRIFEKDALLMVDFAIENQTS